MDSPIRDKRVTRLYGARRALPSRIVTRLSNIIHNAYTVYKITNLLMVQATSLKSRSLPQIQEIDLWST